MLTCKCSGGLARGQHCSRILPYNEQQWSAYMGSHANSHWQRRHWPTIHHDSFIAGHFLCWLIFLPNDRTCVPRQNWNSAILTTITKIILPFEHTLSRWHIRKFSPKIASKHAVISKQTPEILLTKCEFKRNSLTLLETVSVHFRWFVFDFKKLARASSALISRYVHQFRSHCHYFCCRAALVSLIFVNIMFRGVLWGCALSPLGTGKFLGVIVKNS